VGWPSSPAPGGDASSYAAFFGVPVTSTPSATLVFATADAERPFLTENHKMWLFFEPSLRQRLADLDRTAGMAERVRGTLLETLPAGEASMQAVCRRLGVGTRTLQRRLQDEGTTFQQTLDTLRGSLAHHYLRNTALSGAEISFLLGYEDANSFARAFHVWTGRTPQAVRLDAGA
jgi:AraC-like DNA-binding protein